MLVIVFLLNIFTTSAIRCASRKNVLCDVGRWSPITASGGTWTLLNHSSSDGHPNCSVVLTNDGYHVPRMWFGSSDGNTYNTTYDFSAFEFSAEVTLDSAGSAGYSEFGLFFRLSNWSTVDDGWEHGSGYGAYAIVTWRATVWARMLTPSGQKDIADQVKVEGINPVKHKLSIINDVTNNNLYNISFDDVIAHSNLNFSEYNLTSGSIGFYSYYTNLTIHNMIIQELSPACYPTSDPTTSAPSPPSISPTNSPTTINYFDRFNITQILVILFNSTMAQHNATGLANDVFLQNNLTSLLQQRSQSGIGNNQNNNKDNPMIVIEIEKIWAYNASISDNCELKYSIDKVNNEYSKSYYLSWIRFEVKFLNLDTKVDWLQEIDFVMRIFEEELAELEYFINDTISVNYCNVDTVDKNEITNSSLQSFSMISTICVLSVFFCISLFGYIDSTFVRRNENFSFGAIMFAAMCILDVLSGVCVFDALFGFILL